MSYISQWHIGNLLELFLLGGGVGEACVFVGASKSVQLEESGSQKVDQVFIGFVLRKSAGLLAIWGLEHFCRDELETIETPTRQLLLQHHPWRRRREHEAATGKPPALYGYTKPEYRVLVKRTAHC